jgi:hypothetical protein
MNAVVKKLTVQVDGMTLTRLRYLAGIRDYRPDQLSELGRALLAHAVEQAIAEYRDAAKGRILPPQ